MRRFGDNPDLGLRGDLYMDFWQLDYKTKKSYRNEEWYKLMVDQHRVYAHVVVSQPTKNLFWSFGWAGRTATQISENQGRDPDVSIKLPTTVAKKLYTNLQIGLPAAFTRENHLCLLKKGRDNSDKLDPDTGYPALFCCSTYIAWCLQLPKYNTYTTDDLYAYATGL